MNRNRLRYWLVLAMVLPATAAVASEEQKPATYCRYVPERSDDFAWENDLVAFRVYGPALRKGAENSGVDCWAKRVTYPIVDKWYRLDREQKISYHQDHGEGCDFYHVGESRGCGGTAIWHDGKMVLSNVYNDWKVLTSTREQSVFTLSYEYALGGRKIQETKTITIDLGERLFKSESVFTENGRPARLEVAVGLTTHDRRGVATLNRAGGWMSVWESGGGAHIGTGVVMDPQRITGMQEITSRARDESHAILTTRTDRYGRTVHHAGFVWTKAPGIATREQWEAFLGGDSAEPTAGQTTGKLTRKAIIAAADTMALAKFARMNGDYRHRSWIDGAFWSGVTDLSKVSRDPRIREAIRDYCQSRGVGNKGVCVLHLRRGNPHHADDMCVGQTFLDYYVQTEDPTALADTKRRVDAAVSYMLSDEAADKAARFDDLGTHESLTWSWIDALFMAAPLHARLSKLTGDPRYLDSMLVEWKRVSDRLYDKDEHLYYRDKNFLRRKSRNGKKVFWSRGNGWVMGAFAHALPYIPEDHPQRPWLVAQFKEMSVKLASIQRPDGTWCPSLVDYRHFPYQEMSATAFNCFAMAWGINSGILDERTFRPVVQKAWTALLAGRLDNGSLGYVQGVGAEPARVKADHSTGYGDGAFLMAATQLAVLCDAEASRAKASVAKKRASAREKARRVVGRRRPHPDAVVKFDALLREHVKAAVASGATVKFRLQKMRVTAIATGINDKGALQVTVTRPRMQTAVAFERLTFADRVSLARAVLQKKSKSDVESHSLVAFYALCANDEGLAREHLLACGSVAGDVRGMFVEK